MNQPNVARDLWEIFSAKPPKFPEPTAKEYAEAFEGVPAPTLTEQEMDELAADDLHRERIREIEAQRAAKEEAERHDW